MERFILFAPLMCLILMLSNACTSTKYVPVETKVTETVEVHDTTITEKLVTYRDSVAVRDTSSFLSNPYAYSWAVWNNGILHHSLGIWPNAVLIIKVPQYSTITKTIQTPKIVEVEKKLTKWEQMKVDIGGYLMFVSLLLALLMIYKKLR